MTQRSTALIFIVLLLAACGSRAPVVYGGTGGGGGSGGSDAIQNTGSTTEGDSGFVVTDDMPEECSVLATPCDDCDEVERTRRRILKKKCVRVCDAYLDAGPGFSESVHPEIDEALRREGVCGKTETTCSAVDQSRCAYSMKYTTVGRSFIKEWASTSSVPPTEDLLVSYQQSVLQPLDGLNRQVYEWGRVNEIDVTPLLEANASIVRVRLAGTSQEVFGEASSRLPAADSPEGERVRRLYQSALTMWKTAIAPPSSFEDYRVAWDTAAETFLSSRSSSQETEKPKD